MYKVFGWFLVVFGGLGLLGSLAPFDWFGIIGSSLFIFSGYVILDLLKKCLSQA